MLLPIAPRAWQHPLHSPFSPWAPALATTPTFLQPKPQPFTGVTPTPLPLSAPGGAQVALLPTLGTQEYRLWSVTFLDSHPVRSSPSAQ